MKIQARFFPGGGLNSGARLSLSPDGTRMLANVGIDEDTTMKGWNGPPPSVFLVDLNAGTAKRLTPKGVFAWDPSWPADSAFLCIIQREGQREPSVVRMPFAGGAPTVLVRGARTPTLSVR